MAATLATAVTAWAAPTSVGGGSPRDDTSCAATRPDDTQVCPDGGGGHDLGGSSGGIGGVRFIDPATGPWTTASGGQGGNTEEPYGGGARCVQEVVGEVPTCVGGGSPNYF